MDPSEWIKKFREQHEKARMGKMLPDEKKRYLAMREEFARSLVSAQGLSMAPGQTARQTFRVAQALPVEINRTTRVITRDISRGGFSTVINQNFSSGDVVPYVLTLGRGLEPISGEGKVASVQRQPGNYRLSISFGQLSEVDAERLELTLFDAVLSRIAK